VLSPPIRGLAAEQRIPAARIAPGVPRVRGLIAARLNPPPFIVIAATITPTENKTRRH